MQIFVQPSGFNANTIVLEIESTDTIESIKIKVQVSEGIPTSQQRLAYAGKELENSLTLADYNIQNGATLHLLARLHDTIQIYVDIFRGRTISLEVDRLDTIGHLKGKLQDKEGVPISQHRLLFDGKQLEDNATVLESDIKEGDTIRLCGMQIVVSNCTGIQINLEVNPSDTVYDVITKIKEKAFIPVDKQLLVFEGKQLKDESTLSDSGVRDDSTLHLFRPEWSSVVTSMSVH